MKKAFGEHFLRIVIESFHKLYIRGSNQPILANQGDGGFLKLRRSTEYGLAVRFAILVRPHRDNFYSAVNMWHSVDGYIQLTPLKDRLFITPENVRLVGKLLLI